MITLASFFFNRTLEAFLLLHKSITNWESSRHPKAEPATEEPKKESSLPPKGKYRRDSHFNPSGLGISSSSKGKYYLKTK